MARLVVSAAHKSSGKTAFTIGLAAALTERGRLVQCFKKGPDYIDPLWHARASGRPSCNLDFNTQTPEEMLALIAARGRAADLELIEGNKGLHDGLDLEGSDSTAALAKLTGAPVVLVLDASGVTRGIAPLVLGYRHFDRDVDIAGVVLNRVATPRQEAKLRAAIEHYTDVPVLGAIGRRAALVVEERHLGLTTPQETASVDAVIAELARAVAEGVDLDRLSTAAERTPHGLPRREPPIVVTAPAAPVADPVRIGIARDSAFCFYYPDDLEALERAGAELVPFSPIADPALPAVDGLFIGGGFPESHIAALAANRPLRAEVAARGRAGLPIYAECGGLMWLSRSIRWKDDSGPMVGLVPADTVMEDRPQGRGLVVVEETGTAPWDAHDGERRAPPRRVRAHEFHYARLTNVDPQARFAWRVVRGDGIDGAHDGLVVANTLAGFTHLRDTARFGWTERFVALVRAHRDATRAARTAAVAPPPIPPAFAAFARRDPVAAGQALAFGEAR